jgi:hypothetical protein
VGHFGGVEERAQSHADVEDFPGGFGVGEFDGGRAVEFDVLRAGMMMLIGSSGRVGAGREEVSLHVEQLDAEAARGGNGVGKAGISGLGRVAAGCRVGGGLREELALAEVGWEAIVYRKRALDNAMGAAVRACIDVSVVIELLALLGIDLFDHGLDIGLFSGGNILDAFRVPSKVLSAGQVIGVVAAGSVRHVVAVAFETFSSSVTAGGTGRSFVRDEEVCRSEDALGGGVVVDHDEIEVREGINGYAMAMAMAMASMESSVSAPGDGDSQSSGRMRQQQTCSIDHCAGPTKGR